MTAGTMLVDATPLLGESGMRGIGKYVRDLLHGLEEIRDEWAGHLSIRAAVSFAAPDSMANRSALAEAAEEAFALRGSRPTAQLSAERRQAFRIARAHGCGAVHLTEPRGVPYRATVPHVLTCHDLIPLRIPNHYGGSLGRAFLLRTLLRNCYRRANRIVAISHKTSVDLHELLATPYEKIDIIPHGLSWELMHSVAHEDNGLLSGLGLTGATYVFYAGFADYRKNAEGMLAALAHARKSVDVILVWAGSLPDEQRQRVLTQATALGIREHVKLLGFVSDDQLAALYRHALAHLFMSRLEGFGYSVAEAMAAGCPVIVAKNSGTDEVAGFAGLLVDAEDARAAGECIVQLWREPVFRQTQVMNGLRRVQTFNKRDMARSYVQTYLRVLTKRTKAPALNLE